MGGLVGAKLQRERRGGGGCGAHRRRGGRGLGRSGAKVADPPEAGASGVRAEGVAGADHDAPEGREEGGGGEGEDGVQGGRTGRGTGESGGRRGAREAGGARLQW